MLALPFNDLEIKEPQILCSLSLKRKKIEPAGRAFQKFIRGEIKEENEQKELQEEKEIKDHIDLEKLNKKRKRSWTVKNGDNFYDILKLPSRIETTEELVKKQYKKMALKNHPDKFGKDEWTEARKTKWHKV